MSLSDVIFFGAISMLLLHEMDAVDKREWRLLFVLRTLPDEGALRWFIGLHVPLFVALLVLVAAVESATVSRIEGGVDVFLILHAALHERIGSHGETAFANNFSRLLIWSAAGLGAAHLVYLAFG